MFSFAATEELRIFLEEMQVQNKMTIQSKHVVSSVSQRVKDVDVGILIFSGLLVFGLLLGIYALSLEVGHGVLGLTVYP